MRDPKKILISGASSGLGSALALQYAKEGVTLFLNGRDEMRLQEIAALCKARGANVISAAIDVRDKILITEWIKKIAAEYGLDLVIANAGVSAGTARGLESGEQIEAIFNINIWGVLNIVQPTMEIMSAQKFGQIAIISSLAGMRGLPGSPAYSASKAAVRVYAEALRGLLAPLNIQVNAVCPGYIKTPMTDANKFHMPFLMTAEKAAKIIRCGLIKNRSRIAFPRPFYWLVWLLTSLSTTITDPLFQRLPKK